MPVLERYANTFREKGVNGDTLSYVESANDIDELLEVRIPGFLSRMLLTKLEGWKANGVELSLLAPQPRSSGSGASSVVARPSPPLRGSSGPFIKLSTSLGAGKKSSGDTIILDASLVYPTTEILVKAKIGSNFDVLRLENERMTILHSSNHQCFIKPYGGIYSGASGEIVGQKGDDLSSYCAIVMERGEYDLGVYLNKQHTLPGGELRLICESLTNVVEAAHALRLVLGDFKIQNIVCCSYQFQRDFKAIDFDNTRDEGEDITNGTSTTPSIASPEMARLLLAREERREPPTTKASWTSDIFSLGLTLFFIANHKRSLWTVLGVEDSDKIGILKCSSNLTDKAVEDAVNQQFSGENRRALRTVLVDALRVNPVHRRTATELKHHSFYGNDPTFSPSQLSDGMNKLTKDVKSGFQMVQLSFEEMKEKLGNLAASQSELGTLIRQAAADAAENQGETKKGLEALGETMTSSIRAFEGMGASDLQALIQSVVTSSIDATSGMGEELKSFMVQCAENAKRTNESQQLTEILRTLVNLKDDVMNVASEIKELRGDLAMVNETLGSRLNVLHTMVMNEKKYSPVTILIFPLNPKNFLERAKNKFSSEYVLFFACPVTKKIMKSGREGKGYKVSVTKDWVKRVAPILIMTLKICAFAAAAYGVPLPLPALPGGSNQAEALLDKMVEEFGGVVEEKVEGWTAAQNDEREDAFDAAMEALKRCDEKATMSATQVRKLKKNVKESMGEPKLGVDVYPAIRNLLKKLEGVEGQAEETWKPSFTGLQMVNCVADGTTAWVSQEAVEVFKEKGMAAILE